MNFNYYCLFYLNFAKAEKKIGGLIVILSLNEGQGHQKKIPIQVHLGHISIKYVGMLHKEIFRFQCGTAAVAVPAAHTPVKQRACQL